MISLFMCVGQMLVVDREKTLAKDREDDQSDNEGTDHSCKHRLEDLSSMLDVDFFFAYTILRASLIHERG